MTDYKLVPLTPTPEMVEAAEDAYMPFGDMELAIRMALLAAPAVQGEAVAVMYEDGSLLSKADCGDNFEICCKVQTPLYAAPQPAEQQPAPDVAGLVEVLTMARETIASALRANAPDYFTTDADIARHVVIQRIDTALAAHRKRESSHD